VYKPDFTGFVFKSADGRLFNHKQLTDEEIPALGNGDSGAMVIDSSGWEPGGNLLASKSGDKQVLIIWTTFPMSSPTVMPAPR